MSKRDSANAQATQPAAGRSPSGARLFNVARKDLFEGIWLVTDTSLIKGTRSGDQHHFAAPQTARQMLRRIFVAPRIEVRIAQTWAELGYPQEQLAQLRRRSLHQIARSVREEFAIGLTGQSPRAGHASGIAALLREIRQLKATLVQEFHSAAMAIPATLLGNLIGTGAALILIDGAVHRAPAPHKPRTARPSRTRRPVAPVSIAASDIEPVGLTLDTLPRWMDVSIKEAIEAWRRQAAPKARSQIERIVRHAAEGYRDAEEWTVARGESCHGSRYRVRLTDRAVLVEKRNTQSWYAPSPKQAFQRFPGHRIRIELSALAEIESVNILEPRDHRFVAPNGEMCLPEAPGRIRAWQSNPRLRVGQVVEKVFRLYEDTLRLGAAWHGDSGPGSSDHPLGSFLSGQHETASGRSPIPSTGSLAARVEGWLFRKQ